MNYIKETRNYLRYINKHRDSSYNNYIRQMATKTITWYTQKPSSVSKSMQPILSDVSFYMIENKKRINIEQIVINEQIIELMKKHTEVAQSDIDELIILLSKYTNAIELFVYHNRDKLTETDVIKLFMIHEVHLSNVFDQSCHRVSRELQII